MRYFTIEEANDLLPTIEPIVRRLVETQAKMGNRAKTAAFTLAQSRGQGGVASSETNALHQAFIDVEALLAKLESFGVVVKNANVGLVDFLADFNGRDVYLCWKYGEPEITHYHELHGGFNGRKPLP